jgi:hypothetical protein
MDTPERRVWGEKRPKDRVTLYIILVFTLTWPKTFTQGRVSVCDKYLHWRVSQDKRIESFNRVLLDRGLYWYQPRTHSALTHVDPDSNKSHVPEL